MRTSLLLLACLLSLATEARAAGPEPGLWQVTIKSGGIPGASGRDQTRTRCVTPEQARDPSAAFSQVPPSAQCKPIESSWSGSKLSFRVQCTLPQGGADTAGTYVFHSPRHYTGTVNTKMTMGGQVMMLATTTEGKRIGECK